MFTLDGQTSAGSTASIDYDAATVADNMLIKPYHDSFYIRHSTAYVSSGSKRFLA